MIILGAFAFGFMYMTGAFFRLASAEQAEISRSANLSRGTFDATSATVTDYTAQLFPRPNTPPNGTVRFQFIAPNGDLYAGAQHVVDTQFSKGQKVQVEFSRPDPTNCRISGIKADNSSSKIITVAITALWVILGCGIAFGRWKSPQSVLPRATAFVLLGIAVFVGYRRPFFPPTEGPRVIQINNTAYAVDLAFSTTQDGRIVEYNNRVLTVDGADYGKLPWHAHVKIVPGRVDIGSIIAPPGRN